MIPGQIHSGLPVCLICGERLANNKSLHVARHVQTKHTTFADKYPEGEERKKAVSELMRKDEIGKFNYTCRFCDHSGNSQAWEAAPPQEEMIEMIPLKCQTLEKDVCEAVLDCLRAKEMETTHLVSVATDGAPSLIGVHGGFLALLQKSLDRKLLTFHCILHQETCARKPFLQNAQRS